MKRWKKILAAGVAALFFSGGATQAVGRDVPKDIFEWVQSTSMAGYYFNREQIVYGKKDGFMDLNTLIVPTIRIYSDKQIEDVVQKRRWRMEKLDGYDKLVGAADYLRFDLAAGTVVVTEHDDLDMNWWPLSKVTNNKEVIKIADLPEKKVDGIFYRSILKWAAEHQEDIIKHTERTGLKLSPADKQRIEEAKNPPPEDKKSKKKKKKKKVKQTEKTEQADQKK